MSKRIRAFILVTFCAVFVLTGCGGDDQGVSVPPATVATHSDVALDAPQTFPSSAPNVTPSTDSGTSPSTTPSSTPTSIPSTGPVVETTQEAIKSRILALNSSHQALPPQYRGLQNLGNTCYANATLQLFMSLIDDKMSPDPGYTPSVNLKEIFDLMGKYLEEKTGSPYLDKKSPLVGYQNDAEEFLRKVLEGVFSDSLRQQIGGLQLATQIIFDDGHKNPLRFSKDPSGQLHYYTVLDPLPLVNSPTSSSGGAVSATVSVNTMVDLYLAPVRVNSVIKEGDFTPPGIIQRGDGDKFLYFYAESPTEIPSRLLIPFKRFELDLATGDYQKSNVVLDDLENIEIPYYLKSDLNLTTAPAAHHLRMTLRGGVIHEGTVKGGHYTAYVYDRHDDYNAGKWYHFNDSVVREVSHQEAVDKIAAYGTILLYDLIN